MEKRNPDNSTCLQALLDMQAVGIGIPDSIVQEVKSSGLLHRADKKLASHMYPDKQIKYAQVYRKTLPVYSALTPQAQSLYMLMVLNVGASGIVSISSAHVVEYLRCTKKTAQAVIRELVASTLIAVHTPGRPKHPALYALNPDYAAIGKGRMSRTVWDGIEVSEIPPKHTTWGHDMVIQSDGTVYAHIVPEPKETEPSSANTVDSSANKSQTKHSTRRRKNASGDDAVMPGQMRFDADGVITEEGPK